MKHATGRGLSPQSRILDRFFTLRVREVHVKIIDALRRKYERPPSRQEMMRMLIEERVPDELILELQDQSNAKVER